MAATHVGTVLTGTPLGSAGTTVSLSWPATVANGDKVIVAHFGAESSGAPNIPGGTSGGSGTLLTLATGGTYTFSTTFHARVWYRDCDGTETGSFNLVGPSTQKFIAVLHLRGTATGSPTIQFLSDTSNPLTFADPTLTAGMVALICSTRGGTHPTSITSDPTGSTSRGSRISSGTGAVSGAAWTREGLTGTPDVGTTTWNQATSNSILATLAFEDGTPPPTPTDDLTFWEAAGGVWLHQLTVQEATP